MTMVVSYPPFKNRIIIVRKSGNWKEMIQLVYKQNSNNISTLSSNCFPISKISSLSALNLALFYSAIELQELMASKRVY
jgi:hypothetical protein